MPWQLIYTSAARLLTAGQTGFGTVARNREIPALVVGAVERASQFARLHGMDAGRVVYSHRTVDAAGTRHHVLSRVASAGADYTGRTNHLAHHVIVTTAEAAELAAAGLSAGDVIGRFPWRSAWDEPARWLEEGDTPALASLPPGGQEHLSAWTEATGDALHANHLVTGEGARNGCIVIAPAKVEMRRLFAESLRAVPEQGWEFTFTTELDAGDAPGNFRWLGFSPGSPVLDSAMAGRRLVLDLTSPGSLPTAEALPKKRRSPVLSGAARKRAAPPRVAAPVGGGFVEPTVAPPPLLVAPLLGTMAAPLLLTSRTHGQRAAMKDGQDRHHGWRMVGFVMLGATAMLGMALLLANKWRTTGEASVRAAPLVSESTTPAAGPETDPGHVASGREAVPMTVPPVTATAPKSSAAAQEVVPWRAAHASQLEKLDLPELRLEQAHMLVMSNGEERGPLIEARNKLSLSLRDPSPVLKLDYAAHRAVWIAAPQSAAAPPLQWRIQKGQLEVLRVLIGDESQSRPLLPEPVSATQDADGNMGGDFAALLHRFDGQALWLRPPPKAAALLSECGYSAPVFVPLRRMKADTSDLMEWVTMEQARMQGTVDSPMIVTGVPAGSPAAVESDFGGKPAAPRSKQTNTLDRVPPPSSSVAGSMEYRQSQHRATAQRRLDKLAELSRGSLMKGRFGPDTCAFLAGPADSPPADAVWIRDVVFAGP